ncbi:pyruvate oxidase [Salinithrix halophila]|uniref:Pyruvate oxidase n=1 Tax=Salinithrix halophila TaxID=1485204 RepID=A0ABV8JET2_9BACL
MFAKTAGKGLVENLLAWGVDHIYGLPGDSINNLMEEFRKEKDRIRFIQVRHEETAALAASSYAKLTGKVGVCLSIAGPGAIHLLNGLYDAKADGAPVLVLAGQISTPHLGRDDFQEVHLERMFADVSVYNERAAAAEELPELLNQAIRTAYAKKGVAILTIPDDLPGKKGKRNPRATSPTYTESVSIPQEEDLTEALGMIRSAKKPLILAGKGCLGAQEELDAFAEKAAAPVILALAGKGALPDEHPYNLGQLGQIGTKPAYEAMEETDLLLLLGTSFPYREYLPEDVLAVQLDIDPSQIGKRYPVEVGLVGDAGTTLRWLTGHLERKEERNFLEKCQKRMADWRKGLAEDEALEEGSPIRPAQVIAQLRKVVDRDAVLSVDVGNVTVWMTRHFPVSDQKWVISSWLATMGCGLPGALAGKIAWPERQTVAVCGDGGFTMVMQDFLTAVKYQLPILVVVLNNEKIGMIQYEQQVMGNLEFGTELEGFDFARFAELCGGIGFRVENSCELAPALEQAAAVGKPALVDVCIEDQPPLPGKITYAQAAGYAKHMIKRLFKNGRVELPPIRKGLKHLT